LATPPREDGAHVAVPEDLERAPPPAGELRIEEDVLLAGEAGAVGHVGSDVAVDEPHLHTEVGVIFSVQKKAMRNENGTSGEEQGKRLERHFDTKAGFNLGVNSRTIETVARSRTCFTGKIPSERLYGRRFTSPSGLLSYWNYCFLAGMTSFDKMAFQL
jgi:hypothetical protein